MARHSIDHSIRADAAPPQNQQGCRGHSEENEINSYFEIEDLSIRSRNSNEKRRQPLENNRDNGRSRLSEQFADACKEKSVARHRIIHARSCEHALAKETERGNCDCDRNPLRAALP